MASAETQTNYIWIPPNLSLEGC